MQKRILGFLMAVSLAQISVGLKAQTTFELDDDPFFYPLETLEVVEHVALEAKSFDPQTVQNWCWAATTATVIDLLFGHDIDPCQIASSALRRPCCSNPSICNQQNSMPAMKSIMAKYGFEIRGYSGRLHSRTVMTDLRLGYPITIRVQGPYGNGHFVNIVGFNALRNGNRRRLYLFVHDPMHGYYDGGPNSMGYAVDFYDLVNGRLGDYPAKWTHSYRYFEFVE